MLAQKQGLQSQAMTSQAGAAVEGVDAVVGQGEQEPEPDAAVFLYEPSEAVEDDGPPAALAS